jgi:hypothetical protein
LRSIAPLVVTGLLVGGLPGPGGAQTTTRLATSVDALLANPVFFHGRQIAILAGTAQDRAVTRVIAGDPAAAAAAPPMHPLFVFWRQAPARGDGEIRGEFWDLGRIREDDSRFTGYDFRPVLEAASGGRWPGRDEVFVLLGASVVEVSQPTTPTLRDIALAPARFADRGVTVTGRFRGRNLFGDLASALNRSRWDFVLQSADAALWVSGVRPRGSGFELDPGAKVDTGRWLEVSGTVRRENSIVWIEGESLRLTKAPSSSEAEPAPTPVIVEAPPAVIFTAPLADETDVPTSTSVRLQFSRDMDGRTFRGRVRVSYVATPSTNTPGPAPAVTAAYQEGNRALAIKFAAPLERFQTVRVDLLEGIAAMDGQPLQPWSMTFSTGAN